MPYSYQDVVSRYRFRILFKETGSGFCFRIRFSHSVVGYRFRSPFQGGVSRNRGPRFLRGTADRAFCGVPRTADRAYCGVPRTADRAFCGVPRTADRAFCGVPRTADLAFCGVPRTADRAFCGDAFGSRFEAASPSTALLSSFVHVGVLMHTYRDTCTKVFTRSTRFI